MTTNDLPECTCPLIDVSAYGRNGIEVAFLLGNPRGSGCPIHETEAMREERRTAEHKARYGDQLKFPRNVGEQEAEEAKRRFLAAYNRDYPHIPMQPDPWLKPRPAPVDTSWITLEPVAGYGWRIILGVLGAVALVALITIIAIVAGG